MAEADGKNGSTPNPWAALLDRAVGVVGALRKMSGEQTSSTNSSSPTQKDSESPERNSDGSIPMPSATDGQGASSSTSRSTGSDSPESSSPFPPPADKFIAREREVTVTFHCLIYGTEEQAKTDSIRILRGAVVRGASIMSATFNGEPIPETTFDPKINPWRSVE